MFSHFLRKCTFAFARVDIMLLLLLFLCPLAFRWTSETTTLLHHVQL